MAKPRIDPDEVRRTAQLARLALRDEEVAQAALELDAILGAMESLAAIDVEGVAPMTHVVEVPLARRPDVASAELSVEEALASAPRRDDGLFLVPRAVAHDKAG